MADVFFEGTQVKVCNFNGVEILTFYGKHQGSFVGSSFRSITIKGLVYSGKEIIARGASFETGSPFSPTYRLENLIGKRDKIKTKNKLEAFPKSKIKYFKSLLGEYYEVRSTGSLLNLEHDNYKPTGWIFADTSVFTTIDLENILKLYDDDIKKLTVDSE